MNKILIRVKQHPLKFIKSFAISYAGIWGFLEPILSIATIRIDKNEWYFLLIFFVISLLIALIINRPKKVVKFNLKNTNTKVEIKFGDLFQEEGHKVIPVNDFFDSEIGKPVSLKSLHGKFIRDILGGNSKVFDEAANAQLHFKEYELFDAKNEGKTKRYQLGTTIILPFKDDYYFLFSLAKSDEECIASCNPSSMLYSLNMLWEKVRSEGNGYDINIPLIGNGLSGVGLPPSQLIQLILISLLSFTKREELSNKVNIILLEETFEEVDLDIIKNNWK